MPQERSHCVHRGTDADQPPRATTTRAWQACVIGILSNAAIALDEQSSMLAFVLGCFLSEFPEAITASATMWQVTRSPRCRLARLGLAVAADPLL